MRKIQEAVSNTSGWKQFKKVGSQGPSGEALTAFQSLDSELRELGIFLVTLGEMECFHKEISGDHKAEWLRKVLEQEKYKQSVASHDFVQAVVNYLQGQQ